MPVNTSSGCKLYIGDDNTVTSDPVADTNYQAVGFIANLGEFGAQFALITFDSLPDRNTLKFKGQRNDGKLDVDLGRAPDDAGQAKIVAALPVDHDYNFKVELNDKSAISGSHNTLFFFPAKVMTYTTNIGGPTQVVHAKATIEIKSGSIVEIPAT